MYITSNYSYSFICCCLLALVALVQSVPTVSFKQNMDQVMKQWNCNKPKPRLVYLEDEYDEYNPSAIYLPHAAVVQRCGQTSGCCKTGQICSPAEEEAIIFVFEQFLQGKKLKKEITLTNHLRCMCQSSGSDSPR